MGSPIETSLFNALVEARPQGRILWITEPGTHRYYQETNDIRPVDLNAPHDPDIDVHGDPEIDDPNTPIEIHREAPVLQYKADLVVTVDKWRRLIVECDGHDFHDRTKQQAAYDRSRDRELLRAGFITIRFTGSEIHHSPERCAAEVYACLASLHDVDLYGEDAFRCGWSHGDASARGLKSDATYGRGA